MRNGAILRRGALVGAVGLMVVGTAVALGAPVQAKVKPTWQTNGRVEAIAIVGSTAYIGGQFTSVRPAGDPAGTGEVARNRVAAINLSTGALLPWNPNASGTVQAIAASGSTVYLGGSFTQVGGKGHQRVAAVDATSGTPIAAFKPTVDHRGHDACAAWQRPLHGRPVHGCERRVAHLSGGAERLHGRDRLRLHRLGRRAGARGRDDDGRLEARDRRQLHARRRQLAEPHRRGQPDLGRDALVVDAHVLRHRRRWPPTRPASTRRARAAAATSPPSTRPAGR